MKNQTIVADRDSTEKCTEKTEGRSFILITAMHLNCGQHRRHKAKTDNLRTA